LNREAGARGEGADGGDEDEAITARGAAEFFSCC